MDAIKSLNKLLYEIFANAYAFANAVDTSDINKEIRDIICIHLPQVLNQFLGKKSDQYKIKGSVGAGRATKTPWIAIMDKDITETTREGVYVVFLFSSDYKNVYLTLNQGTTIPGHFGQRLSKKDIIKKTLSIRNSLKEVNELLNEDSDVDIADERYKVGAVYYTLWDIEDENKGMEVLSLYLDIYQKYKEVYMSNNNYNINGSTVMELVKSEYHPYLTAIKSKPFLLLAGISGTGKSRIVREFAFKSCPKYLQDKNGTTPGNYCMIEVKPNWHDSTELLGYYSRLGKAGYQFTKFIKFLVKAKMFPNVPFFVCLDEMNLAPVEQYFAEILSILETRKHPKDTETGVVDMGMVKTEPIIDARYFRELSEVSTAKNIQTGETFKNELTDRDIYLKLFGIDTEENIDEEVGKRHDLTTEGLTLPDNVIIIGTVNMDDTTHQFSRKVIDRAMTIEMNGGNLRSMFGGSRDLEYLPEGEQEKWQNAFTRRYVTADEVLEAHSEVADKLMDELPARLETINNALKGTPFEVSYRVLNEFTIMVGVMLDENCDMELDDIINQALNNILLMKILPRIEGDAEMFALSRGYKEKMGVVYNNRLEWLKELAPDIQEVSTEEIPEDEYDAKLPDESKEHQQAAREKIQEMIDRLNNQEYTRFWP
ncbi:MAG: DUF3578 domain-containing protein [Prevotella sp.]|nr:DUF3578 domain-containing protein [Prevotella sp.]